MRTDDINSSGTATGLMVEPVLMVGLTCWPTGTDERDNALESAELEYGVRFELRFPASGRVRVSADGESIDAGFVFTPSQLRELGEFLVRHAGRAGEYLSRYRHADRDEELSQFGQFHFEKSLGD